MEAEEVEVEVEVGKQWKRERKSGGRGGEGGAKSFSVDSVDISWFTMVFFSSSFQCYLIYFCYRCC